MNAEEFFAFVEGVARERFASGNVTQEAPKVFVFTDEGSTFIGVPSADMARAIIALALRKPNVSGVGFVDEAWVASGDAALRAKALGTMPSETPGRREAIIATYYARGMKPRLQMILIEEKDGARVLGETVRQPDGRMHGRIIDGLGGELH